MYTETLAQLWRMMEPSKKILLSTLLLISCISGFNHARAMQKDTTGDLTKLPPMDNVLNSFTSYGYPKYNLIDIIKLYSDSMKTDNEPQVPDTDELLLANIAETNPRLTINAAKDFDYEELDHNDNDARKNENKLYKVINNQPVSYPDIKITQANSVINKDCTRGDLNELCRRRNTTSDDTAKQLAQIPLSQNTSTLDTPHNPSVDRQEFTDDFTGSNTQRGTTNNDIDVKKRLFGRRVFSTCNLDTIDIDLRFSENIDTGEMSLLLTCSGSVQVNKCEGMCTSKVSPSVNHLDGFEKVCSCCKEVTSSTRPVTLTSCVLGDQEVVGYSLTRDVIEPTSCACRQCRN